MITQDFFPAANSDGSMWQGNDVFDTLVRLSSGYGASADTVNSSRSWHPVPYYIDRPYFNFDTSEIPSTATIISATFYLYIDGIGWSGAYQGLIQNTMANPISYENADWGKIGDAAVGATEGASRFNCTTSGVWASWSFNATGLTWVTKGGWTQLAIRCAQDLDDAYVSDGGASFRMADYADSNYWPKLTVQYDVPPSPFPTHRIV